MATAALSIKVTTDSASAGAGLDQAASKTDKFKSAVKKAAIPAAAVTAAVIKFGTEAVQSASRTEQAWGGIDAVFGRNSSTVKKWAADAADSMGLAKSEYGELATVLGSQLKNAGLPLDQVTAKTGSLIKKGADLAAMYGGTTKEAVEALSSALKGETDPIERYGASITAAKVQAEMAAEGTSKLTGKAYDQAKAMATLSLINKQTADSVGAAAREHDTLASRTQQAAAQIENLKSDLGTALLPVVAKVAGKIAFLAAWMAKHKTVTMILIGAIAGLAAGVLVLNAAMLVLSANPIVLIIAGIVAAVVLLGVALTMAYKKSEKFRIVVNAVFKGVKVLARVAAQVVKAVWKAVWSNISTYVRTAGKVIRVVFLAVRTIVKAVASAVRATWKTSTSAIAAMFRGIAVVVRTVVTTIKSVIRTGFSAVVSTIKTATTTIKSVIRTIRDAVGDVITKLGALVSKFKDVKVPGAIKTAVDKIASAVQDVVDAVGSLISKIKDIPTPHIDWPDPPGWFKKLNPLKAVAPPAPSVAVPGRRATTPDARVGASAAASYGAGGIHITVNGALDPEATARQIQRILGGHTRRVSGLVGT